MNYGNNKRFVCIHLYIGICTYIYILYIVISHEHINSERPHTCKKRERGTEINDMITCHVRFGLYLLQNNYVL